MVLLNMLENLYAWIDKSIKSLTLNYIKVLLLDELIQLLFLITPFLITKF